MSDGTYWYQYDPEGNRTARWIDVDQNGLLDSGDADITQYAWDNRNRLTEVSHFADFAALGENDPDSIVDYLYDAENRWIGRDIDSDGDGQIDHQTRFAYDGNQIVLQFEKDLVGGGQHGAANQLTVASLSHRYLWQPGAVDQLMADEQLLSSPEGGEGQGGNGRDKGYDLSQPGEVVWALTDQQGTVRDMAVHGDATGITTVVNHRVYDSFGNLKSQTNAAVDCIFGFTGLPFDPESGFYKTRTRPYDPSTGRWMQPDWIIQLGRQTNLYAYCGNSPTNATDPTGLQIMQEMLDWQDRNGTIPRPKTPGIGFEGLEAALIGILGPNPPADAVAEAEAIAKAIVSAYNANAANPTWWAVRSGAQNLAAGAAWVVTLGHVSTQVEQHRGLYCWQWADVFWDAVADALRKLNGFPKSQYFSWSIGGAKAPNSSNPKEPLIHKWLKITSKQTGQSIYVDDGFAGNHPGFVHTVAPVPGGYTPD